MALSTFIKEFFGTVKLLGQDTNGVDRYIQTETDGKLIGVSYGNDPDGNREPFSLNADHVLKVDVVRGSVVQVDPALLPSAEGNLWDPGTTSADIYEVSFNLVNSTATDVTGVSVGQDIGGAGSLSAAEYWLQGLIVPANGMSGFIGPYIIPGDDVVRGVAGTNNVVAIHWNVRKLV